MSEFRRVALAGLTAGGLLLAACGESPVGPLPAAFTAMGVGLIHSCGIVEGGAAYCWGGNEFGQIGDGSRTSRDQPVPVLGNVLFASVSPGGGHTCGLTPQGKAYCWGFNLNGQLGDGTTQNRTTPTGIDAARTYLRLTAGASYNCGIASDSAAYCWGWNLFSQLGDGGAVDRPTPTLVAGGHKFVSISAHAFHTCGVTADGTAYCWGDNGFGQLGTGDTTSHATPAAVPGGIGFASIAVGLDHTCARATDGTGYCWGRNQWGQLGIADTVDAGDRLLPTPLHGDRFWAELVAGASFNCGIEAATQAGYCWGYSGWGEVGVEVPRQCVGQDSIPFQCSPMPAPVSGDLQFSNIRTATHHACGLSVQGVAYCWGLNESGQLGNGQAGDRIFSILPVRVSGQP